MRPDSSGTINLDLEDFRRLGVRPHECRLTVIRNAAARSAKTLAERQLAAPSEQVALQLSRVATSTYRLLDPRQRHDTFQRAHVGRILPNTLAGAANTNFHNGSSRQGESDVPNVPNRSDDVQLVELIQIDTSPVSSGPSWTATLDDEDLLNTTPWSRQLKRFRRQLHHPVTVLTLTAAVVAVTFALVKWNQDSEQTALRRPATAPEKTSDSEPQPAADQTNAQDLQGTEPSVSPNDSSQQNSNAGDVSDVTTEESPGAPEAVSADPKEPSTTDSLPSVDPAPTIQPPPPSNDPDKSTSSKSMAIDPAPPQLPSVDVGDDAAMKPSPDVDHVAMEANPDSESADLGTSRPTTEYLPDPFESNSLDAVDPADKTATPIAEPSSRPDADSEQPRHLPPSDDEILAARKRIVTALPSLAGPVVAAEAPTRIQAIESLRTGFEVGTADHWTASLMLAELAWLVEDAENVHVRLRRLAANYESSIWHDLATTFQTASESIPSDQSRAHLLRSGLILAEQLLLSESFGDCSQVVVTCKNLAETSRDDQSAGHLNQIAESVTQMIRLSESTDRLVKAAKEGRPPEQPGIAGRYYCLMLRRWDVGLAWLAETSDRRIAAVAQAEFELADSATGDELVGLAERWLTVASRESGRQADSMRLHAADLLRTALEDLTRVERLEVERSIEAIESELPFFALQVFSNQPITDKPAPDAEGPSSVSGLSGRIRIDDRDIGVQLNYTMGVSITSALLDQIAEPLNLSLESATIEMNGQLQLAESSSVQILAATQAKDQTVWIDDKPVRFAPSGTSDATALPAGKHTVRWVFQLEGDAKAFLRMVDAKSSAAIKLHHPDRSDQLPIRTIATVQIRSSR